MQYTHVYGLVVSWLRMTHYSTTNSSENSDTSRVHSQHSQALDYSPTPLECSILHCAIFILEFSSGPILGQIYNVTTTTATTMTKTGWWVSTLFYTIYNLLLTYYIVRFVSSITIPS